MNTPRQFGRMLVCGVCVAGVFLGTVSHAVEPAPVTPVTPGQFLGITIVPFDQLPIPDVLKEQARAEMRQMKERGYQDASTEDEVSYIDRAMEDREKRLKPFDKVRSSLKVIPANLDSPKLKKVTLLGSVASGGETAEGWTGLTRLFRIPGLGTAILEEVDYIASQGGMVIAKESINHDVNGSPAILTVKESRSKKGITELMWANDRKWYTLSLDRALKKPSEVEEILSFARGIAE